VDRIAVAVVNDWKLFKARLEPLAVDLQAGLKNYQPKYSSQQLNLLIATAILKL
jgi:hypothetical protein